MNFNTRHHFSGVVDHAGAKKKALELGTNSGISALSCETIAYQWSFSLLRKYDICCIWPVYRTVHQCTLANPNQFLFLATILTFAYVGIRIHFLDEWTLLNSDMPFQVTRIFCFECTIGAKRTIICEWLAGDWRKSPEAALERAGRGCWGPVGRPQIIVGVQPQVCARQK